MWDAVPIQVHNGAKYISVSFIGNGGCKHICFLLEELVGHYGFRKSLWDYYWVHAASNNLLLLLCWCVTHFSISILRRRERSPCDAHPSRWQGSKLLNLYQIAFDQMTTVFRKFLDVINAGDVAEKHRVNRWITRMRRIQLTSCRLILIPLEATV